MNNLLELDALASGNVWYDEWWLVHTDDRYCDSQYRGQFEAESALEELRKRFPYTDARVMHVHLNEDQTPFSDHIRPCGMLMWPIDPSKRGYSP